jgi:uncharacterized membrane protein (DUF106 family)
VDKVGFLSFLDPALNFVLGPLLNLSPFWGILIMSFIVSLIITLCYKWFTDQNMMKQLKDEMKDYQRQAKELKEHPDQAMAVNKKLMSANMKYMMHSFRPTLITFIPIILIFGWLNAHLAFEPIMPGADFSTTAYFNTDQIYGNITIKVPGGVELLSEETQNIEVNTAKWALRGEASSYILEYEFEGKIYTKDLMITDEKNYAPVEKIISEKGSKLKKITIDNEKVKVIDLGFWKLGWIWSYIIFSIIFSMILRKLMKVY